MLITFQHLHCWLKTQLLLWPLGTLFYMEKQVLSWLLVESLRERTTYPCLYNLHGNSTLVKYQLLFYDVEPILYQAAACRPARSQVHTGVTDYRGPVTIVYKFTCQLQPCLHSELITGPALVSLLYAIIQLEQK